MKVSLKVLICILFLEVVYISYNLFPDFTNIKEQTITDDRGIEVNIPDYPTGVIPSDLRIAPIIETFARESTARDKGKTIMITLPRDVEYISDKTTDQYPMVVLDMSSPSNVLKAYTKLGDIFHREDIANSVVSDCEDAITEAMNVVSDKDKKRVLYLKAPYAIPKKDTIENNILLESNVVSIWDSGAITSEKENEHSFVEVTKEEIESFNPDVIICKTNIGKRAISYDLPELPAVKNGKVFSIEDADYHFEFDEYHSIPAVIWVIKKAYELDTPDPDKFFKWYISATKRNYKF